MTLPDADVNGILNAADLTLTKQAYLANNDFSVRFGSLRADHPDILLNTEETVTFTVKVQNAVTPPQNVSLYDGGK